MNGFPGINSLGKAANSTLSSVNSTVTSTAASIFNSAVGTVSNIGASTIGAVNSLGATTLGAVNSLGTTTLGAAKSLNPFTNAASTNVFTNVAHTNSSSAAKNNSSFLGNSSNTSNNFVNNISKNLSANATAAGGWGPFFGILLFLIAIFLVSMIVFKDQLTAAWKYLVNSIQTALNMNPAPLQTPEQLAAIQAAQVKTPMPTTLDATYKATQDQTGIVNAILPMGTKEVFNVSTNEYTYYDAEPLCRALGAELATYDQVQTAWDKGADWCNYGWAKGQVAIYPTQKETWEKLQGGPQDEHTACGEPGVNGGYFDNPEMRFGVNCYGVKPDQNSNDERILMENGTIPKTVSALKIDQQISDIKNNVDMIGLLPFSSHKWST